MAKCTAETKICHEHHGFLFHRKQGYQLFVRKFHESGVVVVDSLKPSDKGESLMSAVEDKIGHLPSGCELLVGRKKVSLAVLFSH